MSLYIFYIEYKADAEWWALRQTGNDTSPFGARQGEVYLLLVRSWPLHGIVITIIVWCCSRLQPPPRRTRSGGHCDRRATTHRHLERGRERYLN